MEKKKILVVDDESSIRKLLERDLTVNGYDVISACEGGEAIRKARQERPDLIILDIMMPGTDGADVSYTLSEGSSTEHIPIIFLTGLQQTGEQGQNEQKNIILSKPVNWEELHTKITELLPNRAVPIE